MQYKTSYNNILGERNKYKQQCTQAIRQWDQALCERNQFRDELAKAKKEKEELIKEIDQAMNIRIKASKDIKRLTEERNSALHEYSVIMSERDSVHREMEKLQEELQSRSVKTKDYELLQREINAAMCDRDKTIKEVHELRRKLGDQETSESNVKSRESRLNENDKVADQRNLDKAIEDINRLKNEKNDLETKLKNANLEADVAKGRRDWAFTERDKIMLESEGVHALCDKLRKERDRALSELADRIGELNNLKNSQTQEHKNTTSRESLNSNNVKMVTVQQRLENKNHGIILDSGIFIKHLHVNSTFAKEGNLKAGDRVHEVNGVQVRGLSEANKELLKDHETLTLRVETWVDDNNSASLKREFDEKRSDFVNKMIPKELDIGKPVVSKLFTSSERVYSISSTPTQKEFKKPWAHFTETVKEKLDLVKSRRQSVEPCEGDHKSDFYTFNPAEGKQNLDAEKLPVCNGNNNGEKNGNRDHNPIKEMDNMFKSHHIGIQRKASDSESDIDSDAQKYSLEHLDNKIQEMKQNFTSSPMSRNNYIQQLTNHQDVVQSHYLQVQSRIQDSKLKLPPLKKQEDGNKEDYFLASSASETSLNDSLKSGNLDEHEVIYQTDKSSNSIMEEDLNLSEKLSKNTTPTNNVPGQLNPSSLFVPYVPQSQVVTSPKHTSPFPHIKNSLTGLESIPGSHFPQLYQDTNHHHQQQHPPPKYHHLMSPSSTIPKHAYSTRLVI